MSIHVNTNKRCLTITVVAVSVVLCYLLYTLLTAKPPPPVERWTLSEYVLNSEDHSKKQYSQDQKLELLRDNSVVSSDLSNLDLGKMSELQLQLTLHSILDNTQVLCSRKLRMGNLGDGGWEVCDDPKVRPGRTCLVYSFGINYDFSFDDAISETYGCHVYSFDPSMEDESHDRSHLVHFYKLGISNRSYTDEQGWELQTFGQLRQMLGHSTSAIDVLKIDVEYAEWPALPEMLVSGQLTSVRQLLIEFHVLPTSLAELKRRVKIVKDLYAAGFRVFYPHKNVNCGIAVKGFPSKRTSCYEMHYIRQG